jgi:hypothetical protein
MAICRSSRFNDGCYTCTRCYIAVAAGNAAQQQNPACQYVSHPFHATIKVKKQAKLSLKKIATQL